MPKLLMNLRHVPDDECEEVLTLMDEHRFDVYQTPPGPFGITAGGIWLKQSEDYPRARQLLDDYQAERARRARAVWDQARREGRVETLWQAIRRRPGKTLFFLGLGLFILMIFFAPLLEIWRAIGG